MLAPDLLGLVLLKLICQRSLLVLLPLSSQPEAAELQSCRQESDYLGLQLHHRGQVVDQVLVHAHYLRDLDLLVIYLEMMLADSVCAAEPCNHCSCAKLAGGRLSLAEHLGYCSKIDRPD